MNKIKQLFIAGAATLVLAAGNASASLILLTEFEFGPTAYTNMKTNLEAVGHTVDIVDAKVAGNVATALGAKTYDQVFLYDLSATSYLNAADYTALGGFFGTHSSIVIDTRSYGYFFQGNNASEVALLRNIAAAFDSFGGGVWVGTDHDPAWTTNANPFLSLVGINPVTESHSEAVNANDPASILLAGVTTTDLWAAGQSVGRVPLGIQPNGIDMRFHFGHSSAAAGAVPYIAASFGEYVAPDEDPNIHGNNGSIPEPGTMLLMGLGLVGMASARRRKTAK